MARKDDSRKNKENVKPYMTQEISYAINRLSNNFMVIENYINSQSKVPYGVNKSIQEINTILEYLHIYIQGKSLYTAINIHETISKIITTMEKKYNIDLTPVLYLSTTPHVYTNPLIFEEFFSITLEKNIEKGNLPVFISTIQEEDSVKCKIKFASSPYIEKIHIDKTMKLYYDKDNVLVIECPYYKEEKTDTTTLKVKGINHAIIIDDEEELISVISEILNSLGISHTSYTNGYDALEYLMINKDKVDLIILDLNMPVMDGREIYEKIKNDKINTPIILMSGDDILVEIMEKYIDKSDVLVKKPFGRNGLINAIKDISKNI